MNDKKGFVLPAPVILRITDRGSGIAEHFGPFPSEEAAVDFLNEHGPIMLPEWGTPAYEIEVIDDVRPARPVDLFRAFGPFQKDGRVALVHTSDPDTLLKPGDRGTVTRIDDLGTVRVAWDSGSRLGMSVLDGTDEVRPLTDEEIEEEISSPPTLFVPGFARSPAKPGTSFPPSS